MGQMRAAIHHEHGGREVLRIEKISVPAIEDDEIQVEVKACCLNHLDVFCRLGMPGLPIPLPHIAGGDVAGVVSQIGKNVENIQVGDRVLLDPHFVRNGKHFTFGETAWGGLCEYAKIPAENAIPLPGDVTFDQAASLPIAYGTAWKMMMTRARVRQGDRVLILGASGGMGVACVQICKMAGAEVIAASSSAEKLDKLKELGADVLLNYSEIPDWHRFIRDHTDGAGADIIVNYTGGDTWVKSMKAMRKGGKIVTCGATAGFDPKTDIRFIWVRELNIIGSNGWTRDGLLELVELVRQKKLLAVIDKVLPLEETAEGHRLLEDREVIGKVLIRP